MLTALRAGVHHAQVADERDEPARAATRARRADRRSRGVDGRHAQEAPRRRAGNGVGAAVVAQHARLTIFSGVAPEKTVEEIGL